jgi:tetratricopeptide (TPR) repeat protein
MIFDTFLHTIKLHESKFNASTGTTQKPEDQSDVGEPDESGENSEVDEPVPPGEDSDVDEPVPPKPKPEEEASDKYTKATIIWNTTNQIDPQTSLAQVLKKVQEANTLYKAAAWLVPNNKIYAKMVTLSDIKIAGFALMIEGDELQKKGENEKAAKKFQKAIQLLKQKADLNKSAEIAEKRLEELQAVIELTTKNEKGNRAKTYFDAGLEKYKMAWDAEKDERVDEAKKLFADALEDFRMARSNDPNNQQYQNRYKECEKKIQGDKAFNEGVVLQEKGQELKNQKKYEEALKTMNEAKKAYTDAYNVSKNEKFADNIDTVQTVIDDVKLAIANQTLEDKEPGVNPEVRGPKPDEDGGQTTHTDVYHN